jgi:ribosomal protein S18 acetylase RimI-like enzyme
MVTAKGIAIRPCEEHDLDHFGPFGSPRHVAYCREEFDQAERVTILVAVCDDGIPVGKIHIHLDYRDDAVWFEAAAVAPVFRNRDIGSSLIRAAEAFAAEQGLATVELGVEDSNPKARRLYERLGYRSVARKEFLYEGAPVPNPGVVMRKALA